MWIIWQVKKGFEKEFVRKLSKQSSRKNQLFIVSSLVVVTPVSSSSCVQYLCKDDHEKENLVAPIVCSIPCFSSTILMDKKSKVV